MTEKDKELKNPIAQNENTYFDASMIIGSYEIVQIGDLVVGNDYSFEAHKQFAHEFSYIVSGSAQFICDEDVVPVSQGDIIFNPMDSMHNIRCDKKEKNLRYQYIGFRIYEPDDPIDHMLYTYLQNTGWKVAKASASVISAFADILTNQFVKDAFQKKFVENALCNLIISVKRCFDSDEQPTLTNKAETEVNILLLQICSYIDVNCKNIKLLKELPKVFGYSYSYLSSFFSKRFGRTLQDYLLMRRHNMECQMLVQGIPVTKIAEIMGYSTIHSFSHAFHRYSGVYPSEYAITISEEKKKR